MSISHTKIYHFGEKAIEKFGGGEIPAGCDSVHEEEHCREGKGQEICMGS